MGQTLTCRGCGGHLPDRETWEYHLDKAGKCEGLLDPRTGRCRAFAADDLWTPPPPGGISGAAGITLKTGIPGGR